PVVVEPAPVVNPFGDKRLVHTERIQEDRQYLARWDGLGVGAAETREQLARRIFVGHQVGEWEGRPRLSDAALPLTATIAAAVGSSSVKASTSSVTTVERPMKCL